MPEDDSRSGINTVGGDTVGATMEAAGILSHIWIDPLMRSGIGIMSGARAMQVSGTLANGQLVGLPGPSFGPSAGPPSTDGDSARAAWK